MMLLKTKNLKCIVLMNKRGILEINSDIVEIFKQNKINITDGTSYLLLLYYQLFPTYIPESLSIKINSLDIFTIDYSTGEVVWNIPLFEESEEKFEWIEDYMDLFKNSKT